MIDVASKIKNILNKSPSSASSLAVSAAKPSEAWSLAVSIADSSIVTCSSSPQLGGPGAYHEDSEVEFDFDVAEGRSVGINVVVSTENVPPANHVVLAAPSGNGRPRRAGLSICNYNENNHDLEDEIGAESPIKIGSKRRRRL